MVLYTGGFCGVFLLFIFPVFFVYYARKTNHEATYGPNFNKSPY